MKQVPYCGHSIAKCSRHGDLVPAVCAPSVLDVAEVSDSVLKMCVFPAEICTHLF